MFQRGIERQAGCWAMHRNCSAQALFRIHNRYGNGYQPGEKLLVVGADFLASYLRQYGFQSPQVGDGFGCVTLKRKILKDMLLR